MKKLYKIVLLLLALIFLTTFNPSKFDLIQATNNEFFKIISLSKYLDSENILSGDINDDGILNIQDIILIVNMVLSGEYSSLADMNGDGSVNILDVVQIAFIILNPEP